MANATHVERMETEVFELTGRLAKLKTFIAESPIFQTLGDEDRGLLLAQGAAMQTYSHILTMRLEREAASLGYQLADCGTAA